MTRIAIVPSRGRPREYTLSSTSVTTARIAKTSTYGRFRAAARGPAVSVTVAVAMLVASDQVNDREEEDPYDVDEVPIQADEFDGLVILLRESAFERLSRDVRKGETTRGHVGSVHTGLCIERRTVERIDARSDRRVCEGEAVPEVEFLVLEGLDAKEGYPQQQRRKQEDPMFHLVVALDRGERFDHREAAAD